MFLTISTSFPNFLPLKSQTFNSLQFILTKAYPLVNSGLLTIAKSQ